MQQKKRKAEEELFQAEADLKVKNSEVKNLEIELLTLEATVKQLRVQKVEANKRLNDLDTRIAKLEVIYGESQQRLQEEENRIQKTKTDILQARENSDNEDKILEQLRIEGQNRNQKLLNARLFLKQQHEKFVSFVDELTHLERRMACQETESISLKEQMEQMKKILEGVEKDDNNSKQELLEKTFLQENLSNSQQQTTLPSTFSGPFIKNSDPFMSNNNVSEEDPFLSKSEDGNLKIDNNTNNFADFAKFSS